MGPDIMYACDGTWWDTYRDEISYSGSKWTQDVEAAGKYNLNYVESQSGTGLNPHAIVQGSNGTYQAINLLWIWGAKVILTLGLDMQYTFGKSHWHGDHKGKLTNCTGVDGLKMQFANMHPGKYGLEVINCSRHTALECFPKMKLEEALEKYA